MYYYCLGVYLSSDFCEHTCKKRDNCRYYDVDIYSKFKDIWDQFDFLICKEDCKYYVPREPEAEKYSADEVDPFAT